MPSGALSAGSPLAMPDGSTGFIASPDIVGTLGVPWWIGTAALALFASTSILLFLYILSTILRNENLKSFVKFEIYELLTTLVIIVAVLILIQSACGLRVGDFFPRTSVEWGAKSIYQAVQDQFVIFHEMIRGWLFMNYLLNMQLDQMASVTPYSRPLGIGVVSSPLAGFASPFKQISYNVTVALSVGMLINDALLTVFEFSIVAFLKWYLPLGIVLRSFSPTRRIGGTLIAVGIGFLFIFPLTVVLTGTIFFDPGWGGIVAFQDALSGYWQTFDLQGSWEHLVGPSAYSSDGHFSPLDFLAGGFFGIIGRFIETIAGGAVTGFFLIPLSTAGMMFAIGYLMPAFNVMILVQAAKQLGKSLGEEIDITALTRMI